MGHVGAGKYDESVRIIWAKDMLEAHEVARRLGGVKKGTMRGVISIEEVSS